MEEQGHEYPKGWTHGRERTRISDRQRRDFAQYEGGGLQFGGTLRQFRFLAARCFVRYAQEARLSGDEAQVGELLAKARETRESAKAR